MKKCSKCKEFKNESDFYKDISKKDGLRIICKICDSKKRKKYYENNKESEKRKEYYENNKEKLKVRIKKYCEENKEGKKLYDKNYYKEHKKEIRISKQEYYKKNKEKLIEKAHIYKKERLQIDERFRIITNLRIRLSHAFQEFSTTGKIRKSKEYGINYGAIFDYIGPCPGNRSEWHIDHIIPLSAFDFDDPEQVKEAFKPENHQWLTKEENLKKGDKY